MWGWTARRYRPSPCGGAPVAAISLTDGRAELDAGMIRPLAQLAEQRWSGLPNAPTAREQNYDIVFGSTRGFAAPPGLAEAIRARLEAVLRDMTSDPAVQARAAQQGMPLHFISGPDWLADLRRQDIQYREMWRRHPWKE